MDKPRIVHTTEEMKNIILNHKPKERIGFVPTMGYFHEGHLSLIKKAKEQNNIVVVSIFVNPTQFGENEDLEEYPRDIDRDIELLKDLDVEYVFVPEVAEMYPKGYKTYINVEGISHILCGKSRPNHFRGVTTIVAKLINIVMPDLMYLGEKDFQQAVILQKMIEDLNLSTKVIKCPIRREKDGLAKSSRNKYLDEEQRQQALCLIKTLTTLKKEFRLGNKDPEKFKEIAEKIVRNSNSELEYIEFVDPYTLDSVDKIQPGTRALMAVNVGNTRLIDNIRF